MSSCHIFIVGAQKCGTSSLAAAIDHAFVEVELSTPKEPMIFSLGDFECHRTLFCDADTPFFPDDVEKRRLYDECFRTEAPVRLDASTSYMISPEACTSIQRSFPDARIIVVLRDPVERMVSAYWHYLRTGVVCHGFDRAVEFGPSHLVNCGFYLQHLRSLAEVFGRERMLVLSDRHMYSAPEALAERLAAFAGLQRAASFELGRENAGSYPILLRTQFLANYFRQRSGKNFYHRAVTRSRFRTYGLVGGLAELVSRYNLRRAQRPRIESRLVGRLVEMYRLENAGIEAFFDMGDASHWYGDYFRYFTADSLSSGGHCSRA